MTKAIGIGATVTCHNYELGAEASVEVAGSEGIFQFEGLSQGTYTIVVTPSDDRYLPYTRTVAAVTDSAAASAHLPVPLARSLRGAQMMIVVEWGVQASADADSRGVGVATDLDVYLRFGVSNGAGNTGD